MHVAARPYVIPGAVLGGGERRRSHADRAEAREPAPTPHAQHRNPVGRRIHTQRPDHPGFLTDPGYMAFVTDARTEFDLVYGGWNPALVLPDISQLFGIDTGSSGVSDLVDPATAAGGLDAAMSLDLGAAEWLRSRRTVGGGSPRCSTTSAQHWPPDLATSLLNVF
ncbi:MAG: hypothetical protein QOE52_1466 [Mycobacterium sp.]|jgi:hypothetical protein|nr:hypothetical protein [Mycobacterium sp.]MDT5342282.1 hypothetical protein [Mycobacterium sp.]